MSKPTGTSLVSEHAVVLRHLASVQRRCEAQLHQQAEEIARLRAESMQLRAAVIARDSALAWAHEDRQALEAQLPGLASRVTLARQVSQLHERLQELMREKLRPAVATPLQPPPVAAELSALEASLVAADLVICQTGCLSHGAYWRVQDHCKRTGKPCVLVEQPEKLRIMRIHRDASASASLSSEADA